ncbi:2-oxoisovalerate dehydrogenase subunit alpha mitochondrial-like [Raphidocelis subcapitata]|uniref:2-oxoisovalerate dehydrogenase subunit alpha mitochondrial-like n=1 Tax=Raphidocelis subcapitata TaxID=307507 RepID=A0A2V0NYU4_9CHLO|nr:2-oxoisovalerate dehydrogenase subunit alpha mitochondrial-like [Raphidocelis subcapitata]|eukprot:GBF89985.1 2-oxoisovalerate dehydrogenase subunit alpha mitochondrial-like [Raphidocelis subcapitata]
MSLLLGSRFSLAAAGALRAAGSSAAAALTQLHCPSGAGVAGGGTAPSAARSKSSSSGAGEFGCEDAAETMEIPGGRIPVTRALRFAGGPSEPDSPKMPCYRVLDPAGRLLPGAEQPHPPSGPELVALYEAMARLQVMDTIFYEAQRQGRFSFYMTCAGEEAAIVGSAAGLDPQDQVFSQYREHGVLLWRGFSFDDFANQCYGNELEPGKGRQMPIHYGSTRLAYHTVSSPLATQLPHAVGTAYALKLRRSPNVGVAYFGEGASSEGDCHAALNFAAVLGAPCLFICRNNGYAISTPSYEQYRGDGVASRGPPLGVPSIRVDGGDAVAVVNATRAARALAVREGCPVLIEAMCYRSGHHSTSDDSSRYRTREEMAEFRARDPAVRLRQHLDAAGLWDAARDAELRRAARVQAVAALDAAARVPKAPLSSAFEDVYKEAPWHIREQRDAALAFARAHPHVVPQGVPLR